MKLQQIVGGILVAGVLAASAHAQLLGKITASPMTAKVGEPVTITANIDIVSGNYCGFVVGFGDGSFKDAVSDKGNPVPLVLQHTYTKPGSYHVTLGGKNVQNRPNCAGPERAVDITITEAPKPAAAAAPAPPAKDAAAALCPSGWKLVPKSANAKTGAFACSAKPGTALPETKVQCKGDLTYYENVKRGQLGCRM